jgi:uncharacterized protein (UPF0371 family)
MTPSHFKLVMRDIEKNTEDEHPVCAFAMRNGQIYTGNWTPLSNACNTLVVTLINKEAPPIYLDVHAIDAIALGRFEEVIVGEP